MNRAQFMKRLSELLSDIPEDERNEALDYYESYFDDAGVENEAQVIQKLGSPGKVAAIIKANLREGDEAGEYTETGYQDQWSKREAQMPEVRGRRGLGAKVILLIIAAVLFFPLIGGVLGGAFSVAASIVTVIVLLPIILVVTFGATSIGLILGGALGISGGIVKVLSIASIGTGMIMIGLGLICIAAGVVFALLTLWIACKIVPAFVRRIIDVCQTLFSKVKNVARRRG